jgi:hypothetical protein
LKVKPVSLLTCVNTMPISKQNWLQFYTDHNHWRTSQALSIVE